MATGFGAILSQGGAGYPTQSLDFEASSSQSLSMARNDFGGFDLEKFAVSVWFRLESVDDERPIFSQARGGAGQTAPVVLGVRGGGRINFAASSSSGTGLLLTTATYSTATWHHLLAHYDSGNATTGDRMRLWVNGSEVTAFDSDSVPTDPIKAENGALQWGAGTYEAPDGSVVNYFDGLLYQPLFFSGALPSASLLYNSGRPTEVRSLPGLFSFPDLAGGSVTSDYVLATDWTNNNGVTASATVP
jgi:hypothetical protein